MKKITVSFNNQNTKKNPSKKEKIILTYHPEVKEVPEKLTYLDNGIEVDFTDTSYNILKISKVKSIAKKTQVEKVGLNFIEAKDKVEYQEGYFTKKGEVDKFLDPVRFDKESNSYIGTIDKTIVYDKEIKLYEE